jgi:nicotinate-nucleotide adenylyltransferase
VKALLFGGSFDPVHHGHLIVARSVAEQIGVQRIWLVPAACPPHKPQRVLAPGQDRLAMCRLAVAGDPLFEVTDCELVRGGPSYTLLTVQEFARALPAGSELFWLIGTDSLAELAGWHQVRELVRGCTLVTARRAGSAVPDEAALASIVGAEAAARIRSYILPTPRIDISATEVRERVAAGRDIRYLVPPAVAEYIAARGLYAGEPPA